MCPVFVPVDGLCLKCEKGSCALRHGCSPKPRPFPLVSLTLGSSRAPLQQHLFHLSAGLYKQRVLQVSAFDGIRPRAPFLQPAMPGREHNQESSHSPCQHSQLQLWDMGSSQTHPREHMEHGTWKGAAVCDVGFGRCGSRAGSSFFPNCTLALFPHTGLQIRLQTCVPCSGQGRLSPTRVRSWPWLLGWGRELGCGSDLAMAAGM